MTSAQIVAFSVVCCCFLAFLRLEVLAGLVGCSFLGFSPLSRWTKACHWLGEVFQSVWILSRSAARRIAQATS